MDFGGRQGLVIAAELQINNLVFPRKVDKSWQDFRRQVEHGPTSP